MALRCASFPPLHEVSRTDPGPARHIERRSKKRERREASRYNVSKLLFELEQRQQSLLLEEEDLRARELSLELSTQDQKEIMNKLLEQVKVKMARADKTQEEMEMVLSANRQAVNYTTGKDPGASPLLFLRTLGVGGEAKVWEAFDLRRREMRAVKIHFDQEKVATEWRNSNWARANHVPNTLSPDEIASIPNSLREGRESRGKDFLALSMPLAQGTLFDLAAKVEKGERKISGPQVVSVAEQVSCSLAKLHQLGTAHGDLKAENIFLMSGMAQEEPISVCVGDLGAIQISRDVTSHATKKFSPPDLDPNPSIIGERDTDSVASEVAGRIMGQSPAGLMATNRGEEVDCWGLGCALLTLICSGSGLSHPTAHPPPPPSPGQPRNASKADGPASCFGSLVGGLSYLREHSSPSWGESETPNSITGQREARAAAEATVALLLLPSGRRISASGARAALGNIPRCLARNPV